MCWAALDRGIRIAQDFGLDAPMEEWRKTRADIRRAILERGFDSNLKAFTRSFGSRELDAAALAIPRIGFLGATDPRVTSTVERISAELTHHGLVYIYRADDGLPAGEATFAVCSFWLADALASAGQIDEAHDLFEKVVGYANDVGLLSEEIDPSDGQLVGNFPQGFTHLGLIGTAVNLAKMNKHGAEEHPETEGERVHLARSAASDCYARARK